MASANETNSTPTMNKMAFVLGYTGETGKAVVREMSKQKMFKKVVLIGRREVKLEPDTNENFEQRIVDFDNLTEHKEAFRDLDTGFCCLGTTKGKGGKAGFIKVDHDYVVNSAELAKSVGCKHFLVVSSYGSNKSSFFLYPRVKGEVEEELKAMEFERLSIFKPGMLLCDRVEKRPMESFIRFLYKPLPKSVLRYSGITTENLAKTMLNTAVSDSHDKVEVIDNKQMYDILENQEK